MVREVKVDDFPRAADNNDGRPNGMFILERIPSSNLQVLPFQPLDRNNLQGILKYASEKWKGSKLNQFHEDWVEFESNLFPKTSDAEEYIKSNYSSYHVPFANEMFTLQPPTNSASAAGKRKLESSILADNIVKSAANASVQWLH
jgi:hypothetical protein